MKACILLLFYMGSVKSTNIQETFHNGNTQFTARMFSEVVTKNKGKSVVLSAFSVITPLSQLAVASEGSTHDELLNAVGFPDDDTTNAAFALMNDKFNSVQGIKLKKASRLYIPLGYQIHDAFATASKYVYHSEIVNIDFKDSKTTANKINTWVEDQTNHRIKNLINPSSITPDSRGVLVNALYFKGTWKYPFNSYATTSQDFYVNNKDTIQIEMMNKKENYKYKESNALKSKILELPYKGEQSSFVVILPNDIEGIEQLLEKLKDPYTLDKATRNMKNNKVSVTMPKFKIETKTDLKEVLIKLNVTKIFDEFANLTKLLKTDDNLYISDAVQKAFIEINEEGAEAAAANAFGVVATSLLIESPSFVFIADHPFVYFLKVHDEIIFNGVFYGS